LVRGPWPLVLGPRLVLDRGLLGPGLRALANGS
jgi:hypothetical protein